MRAADLPAYLKTGQATAEMRRVRFPLAGPAGAGSGGGRAHYPADASVALPGVLCRRSAGGLGRWWRRCWPAWRSSRRCCRGCPPPISAARGSSWGCLVALPFAALAAAATAPPGGSGLLRAAGLSAGAAGRDGLPGAQLHRRHPAHLSQRRGGRDQDLHPADGHCCAGLGILLVLAALVPGLAGVVRRPAALPGADRACSIIIA